jgi:hypothetical protein
MVGKKNMFWNRFPKQFIPLTIIFIMAVAALVLARAFLVPESFGKYGHYRADAVEEIAALPVVYAGAKACGDCHDDIVSLKGGSHHQGVACEACHGPAAAHTENPDEVKPQIPQGRGHCPICHGYNPSRPSGFPQIMPDRHNPGRPCIACHNPHSPTLPSAPEECAACHREIANDKMVSPHTMLACAQCHTVPVEHLTSPRIARAEKPTDKSTCAQCHSRVGGKKLVAPIVDFETHGAGYLCWDCHYPHHPEANL